MERMTSLILLLVGLVFSHYEFLVVFRQVWVWDRKKGGRAWVGETCGEGWVQVRSVGWEQGRFLKLL